MARCSQRVRNLCILLQIVLGAAITATSVYAHLLVPAMGMREKPLWAGIPLCLGGTLGLVACLINRRVGPEFTPLFVVKVVTTVLSVCSVFTCLIASVFSGIHLKHLLTYAYCQHVPDGCRCFWSSHEHSKSIFYTPVSDCFQVYCQVKAVLIVQGSLALLGSLSALGFLVVIWKSRYGDIATGQPANHGKNSRSPVVAGEAEDEL